MPRHRRKPTLDESYKKALAATTERQANQLVDQIKRLGLAKNVRAWYDHSQGNAPEYDELLSSKGEEVAEWHAHDYAIEMLWNRLAEAGVVFPEGTTEATLSEAFAKLS